MENLNVNRVGAARSCVESDIKSKSKPEVQTFQLQKKKEELELKDRCMLNSISKKCFFLNLTTTSYVKM